jgi:hypothetical protein
VVQARLLFSRRNPLSSAPVATVFLFQNPYKIIISVKS